MYSTTDLVWAIMLGQVSMGLAFALFISAAWLIKGTSKENAVLKRRVQVMEAVINEYGRRHSAECQEVIKKLS